MYMYFACNRLLALSSFDSKIMFLMSVIWVISLTEDKMVSIPGKSNGADKEFWV